MHSLLSFFWKMWIHNWVHILEDATAFVTQCTSNPETLPFYIFILDSYESTVMSYIYSTCAHISMKYRTWMVTAAYVSRLSFKSNSSFSHRLSLCRRKAR